MGEGRGGETRRDESGCGAGLCFAWISLFVSSRWLEGKERVTVDFSKTTQTNTKKKRDDDDDEVEGFGVGLVDLTWSP